LAAAQTKIALLGRVIPLMGGKIRRVTAALAAVLFSALAATFFPGCSSSAQRTERACAQARIGGRVVCLRPHERCERRYERVYRSYGLTCKDDRLRDRSYIGPANP
jgi:hypothetical protein